MVLKNKLTWEISLLQNGHIGKDGFENCNSDAEKNKLSLYFATNCACIYKENMNRSLPPVILRPP